MGGSEESPVSMANMESLRSSKHSSRESYPDFDPRTENHGVHMWAGTKTASSPDSRTISNRFFDGNPRIGRPSERIFPRESSLVWIFLRVSKEEVSMRLWTLRVFPFFL